MAHSKGASILGDTPMTTFKRINLLRPIKFFLNRIRYSKSVAQEPSGIAKNPWQEDLVRLAAERRLRESDPEQQDEITHFVNNLAKSAQEGKDAEAKAFTGKYKRQGDKTVNDLKSWW